MQSNLEFVTDGSKVYRLGGNDWYAVEQDDGKVMLVDTDCQIAGKELETPWSDYFLSEDGENGQTILNYVNNIADTYFNDIKHAIIPRSVEAGICKLENAYMWPMSKEEFGGNKVVGGKIGDKIAHNFYSFVWTRTFSGVSSNSNYRCAWFVYSSGGSFSGSNSSVSVVFRVAPAFNLKKSAIDHITKDGEIILKSEDNVD